MLVFRVVSASERRIGGAGDPSFVVSRFRGQSMRRVLHANENCCNSQFQIARI
jgi:hypothetical protein